MKEMNIDKLRATVKSNLDRHHYEAAIFWGDKIVTLSDGDPVDVYWLVQAYISTGQFHRARQLIATHDLYGNGTHCYLAAYCYYKTADYEEAISLLEPPKWPCKITSFDPKSPVMIGSSHLLPNTTSLSVPEIDDIMALECSRQLLRAKIYETIDNPSLASQCYKAALHADPLCYDALIALTSHYMMTIQEEQNLLDSLPLGVHCDGKQESEFVKFCYQTKLNKCSENSTSKDSNEGGQTPGLLKSNSISIDYDSLPLNMVPLKDNVDILTAKAESLYYKCKFAESYYLTKRVLDIDSHHTECLPIHIACLIELQQPNALFRLAHNLIDLYPESALAWFSVGCYYYLIGKNEQARRFLSKSTSLDKSYRPAWIAYAHSFAAENEHDQASAAYFKAANLMKGSHLPLLYIGMEYNLANKTIFAERFFLEAKQMAPNDPFVHHEIGVMHFHSQDYDLAETSFRNALELIEKLYTEEHYYSIPSKWTSLYNNLGHCLRKKGKYLEAVDFHLQAVRLIPTEASSFTAIGLCYGALGRFEEAIEAVHNSLALQRDQTVAVSLLNSLMEFVTQDADKEITGELPMYSDIASTISNKTAEAMQTPVLRTRPLLPSFSYNKKRSGSKGLIINTLSMPSASVSLTEDMCVLESSSSFLPDSSLPSTSKSEVLASPLETVPPSSEILGGEEVPDHQQEEVVVTESAMAVSENITTSEDEREFSSILIRISTVDESVESLNDMVMDDDSD